jgi:hypothetical protein
MSEWERYGQVGVTHANGDRIVGFVSGYARDLADAGTPNVSTLAKSSLTQAIGAVDIGDRLTVVDMVVSLGDEMVGRITGPLVKALGGTGELVVERVIVNGSTVVNVGGIFYPHA